MDGPSSRRIRTLLFALALAAAAAALYAPIFRSPPVQDDYNWLALLQRPDGAARLRTAFDPLVGYFYRPLSALYHGLLYRSFGSNPVGYRVGAVLWLTLHGLLFSAFLRRWLGDRRVAVAGAFLLLAASPCWQDAVRWGVGISDLGCLAGFLGALACFASGRPVAAAACQLLALGFKESAATLPAILALLWWQGGARGGWRGLLRQVGPTALLTALYLALRLVALARHDFAAGSPYALGVQETRQLANLAAYAKWAFDAAAPALAFSGLKERGFGWLWVSPRATAAAAALFLAAAAWLAWRRRPSGAAALWAPLALLPVLASPAQAYRYYLLYALPAVLVLLLLFLHRVGRARRGLLLACWVAGSLAGGWRYFHRLDAAGWNLGYIDGTNQLSHRADVARRVRAALDARGPWTPGDVLMVEGVDPWSFVRSRGLRVWTGDPGAVACAREDVVPRGGAFVIRGDRRLLATVVPGGGAVPAEWRVDPRRIVYLRREGDRLVDRTADLRAGGG